MLAAAGSDGCITSMAGLISLAGVGVALGVDEFVGEADGDVVPALLGSLPELQPESAKAAAAITPIEAIRKRG